MWSIIQVDGSSNSSARDFPDVLLIENKNNVGFSEANNQAIRQAKRQVHFIAEPRYSGRGKIPFEKTVKTFMNQHPEAGGLGVK
ncbi:MAG: hypothetical protein R3E08_10515 [Thiotrichaceae bacterium]